ncbi:UDP-3-O-(3-hydroxymyristoyl)glucosamine N-acyltransferase [Fusobacterium necrophorum]|uniref:UDP-3-O-(3-hydroxymyristoyl) glucosamine N-acyltransferase n=1 Tax=Fusobacterium necrophorum DJ-2 TaxID=1441737 RepID=A0AB73C2E8_9FUSO|nr:UDP-3-O-(3-hydroxymyristoyl)glucosamine N-acyltransferase [Fusobacterium necrophorum]KDE60862.1 UDP-3-O-(3-hydroxymyristoyl) glucosamine N-acyltransferase [Fusobacterium necrophorum BFTR-1]KDE67779.1 UDP-3-O-(3-hydroxymyristoyl) glucosamine N-acyltransferase [Fusobacterium necrophorum DJ-1]KDE71869.1 UDP-3-O-(3-hydroxymyristoyl) glucosamine N-acyltransferase [Fusobacterium necrophorum DJ-2]MCF0163510.1 UDP-3-O-(3-hydroxymyristoyl)glucosamine N-acyltransferase [Fusobacterium necrophorum]
MKLSKIGFGEVLRDGEFDWLGLTAEIYKGKHHLTFLMSEKFVEELNHNLGVSCVITSKEIAEKVRKDIGILVVDNPKKVFFEFHNQLAKEGFYVKMQKDNNISNKAMIADTVKIRGKNVVIEDNVIIEDNVVIYDDVTIKSGTRVGAGTIIGCRPFQFVKLENEVFSVDAIGSVFIDECAEIQCNTTIVKGVFGETYIGKNVCIDNLVHIAHDVKIEENTLIVSGSIIGGRTRIAKNSYTGINASIKNGLILEENTRVSMGAVVSKNVSINQTVTGNLAIEHNKFMKKFKESLK